MRCSGVCTMWQPARNRSGMRRVTGNSRPRRSVRWLPPTRTQDEASRGASTPKHAASHSRNTASVGVKKFFQNGRHSIAPSAAHQPLTMAAPCRGTENSIDLPFRRNREPPVRGYFTSARFQLCASSWNAVFLASTTTLSFTRICVLPRGTISSPSRVMEMTTASLGMTSSASVFPAWAKPCGMSTSVSEAVPRKAE